VLLLSHVADVHYTLDCHKLVQYSKSLHRPTEHYLDSKCMSVRDCVKALTSTTSVTAPSDSIYSAVIDTLAAIATVSSVRAMPSIDHTRHKEGDARELQLCSDTITVSNVLGTCTFAKH
jgi:hypothetical protein